MSLSLRVSPATTRDDRHDISIVFAGTELVEFSPSVKLAKTAEAIARNLAAGVEPGTPEGSG